jgi:hypothetical protein
MRAGLFTHFTSQIVHFTILSIWLVKCSLFYQSDRPTCKMKNLIYPFSARECGEWANEKWWNAFHFTIFGHFALTTKNDLMSTRPRSAYQRKMWLSLSHHIFIWVALYASVHVLYVLRTDTARCHVVTLSLTSTTLIAVRRTRAAAVYVVLSFGGWLFFGKSKQNRGQIFFSEPKRFILGREAQNPYITAKKTREDPLWNYFSVSRLVHYRWFYSTYVLTGLANQKFQKPGGYSTGKNSKMEKWHARHGWRLRDLHRNAASFGVRLLVN